MRSIEENIEALSRSVDDEAKAEAEQILAEARERAEALRQRAQEQANAEGDAILDRARQEASRIRGQVIATTHMKARTIELEHREQLLEKVFVTVQTQLPNAQQMTDYNEVAQRLVREAVAQLRANEVKIRADQHTRSLLSKEILDQISKEQNVQISLGDPLENGVGVIAETADGHLQFDNTLGTRLNRLRNALRSPVYRILIGEPL